MQDKLWPIRFVDDATWASLQKNFTWLGIQDGDSAEYVAAFLMVAAISKTEERPRQIDIGHIRTIEQMFRDHCDLAAQGMELAVRGLFNNTGDTLSDEHIRVLCNLSRILNHYGQNRVQADECECWDEGTLSDLVRQAVKIPVKELTNKAGSSRAQQPNPYLAITNIFSAALRYLDRNNTSYNSSECQIDFSKNMLDYIVDHMKCADITTPDSLDLCVLSVLEKLLPDDRMQELRPHIATMLGHTDIGANPLFGIRFPRLIDAINEPVAYSIAPAP